MQAEFKYTPREIDEMFLDELIDCHSMLSVLRRQRMADIAQAVRIGQIDKREKFERALKDLLR